jgi:hypothetical protein
VKKTYLVVGDSIVHGFAKGSTFTADLEPHEEALLIQGGHVVVKDSKKYETAAVVEPVETATEKP